jgi:hypothetical protein
MLLSRVFSHWATAANRARIADLESELADMQGELRVAQAENRLLSEVIESDIARRRRERAVFDRDRAQAVAAMPGSAHDESEV